MKKLFGIVLVLALVLSLSLVATTPLAAAPPVTSGLVLHLDADDMTGLTDGAAVASWSDLSGQDNHATQGTEANRPTYKTGVLAGKPVVRFDGSRYLVTPEFAVSQPHYIFVVWSINDGGDNQFAVSGRFHDVTWTYHQVQWFDGDLRLFAGAALPYSKSKPFSHMMTTAFFSGASSEVWEDGISQTTGNAGTTGIERGVGIGADIQGGNPLTGDIAEILIYDRALSDTEREQVEQYLGVKWLPTCLATATGTGTACFYSSQGTIQNLTAVPEATLPLAGKPRLAFPHGFFALDVVDVTPGATVTVSIMLPQPVPTGTEYWKYYNDAWHQIPMTIDPNDSRIIHITLVDGGLGDADGEANGTIDDQGGPGTPRQTVGWEGSSVNKVAVLAPWLALLAAMMAGATLLVVRRQRAQT